MQADPAIKMAAQERFRFEAQIASVLVEDASAVRDLMERTIRLSVTEDERLLAETIANVKRNLDHWLGHPASCVHLKATVSASLVGVVLVKDFWNLCSLFVDPAHHGRGIGRALVESVAAACRGRSPKDALLLNAATNAIPFYERLGFRERPTNQALPPGFLAMQRPL